MSEQLRALNPYKPETSEHHAWAHGLATALADGVTTEPGKADQQRLRMAGLREAVEEAANATATALTDHGLASDPFHAIIMPLRRADSYLKAIERAAPSTPEPGPLTYVGGVPHNHSHDRNRECREVLVGACLAAATSTPEPEIDVSEQ